MNMARVFSLLLALVVLISCLPVLPVSAASVPAGVYDLSSGFTYFGEFAFSCKGYLYSDGSKKTFDFLRCYVDGDPALFFGESEDFYIDYKGYCNFDAAVFYLTAPVSLEGNAFTFFQQFLSTYKLIIDDHEEHSHTEPWFSQNVVESTGTTFECSLCSWESVFTPSGTGTFAGFKDASGNTYFGQCTFDVDASELRLSSIYTTIPDPDPVQTYALIIDDHEVHSHTEPWFSQNVVESTGTTFECSLCSWESVFTPSGTGTFAGFKDSSGNTYFGQCIFDVDASELRLTSTYSTLTDPDPGPGVTYTSTITIDGQKFIFTSTTEQPTISLEVLSSGAVMSYGDQIKYYVYPGSATFLGLGAFPSGDAVFVPGQTYSLAAGDFTLFSIEEVSEFPTVSVVIDSQAFSFLAEEFPVYITVTVTESGCQLTDGERILTYTYSGEGVFSGLTFESGSDPVYVVGDEISVEFRDAANSTFTLYPCFELEGEGIAGILAVLKDLYKKFVGWLDNSLSIPEIAGSLNIVDFGSIKSFFVDAYQGITSLFGLRDLMEDPAGPFAWLLES